MLTISCLYFILSGLQFWTTVYLNTVVRAPLSEVYTFYIVTSLTAPLFAVILSVIIFNCAGGYNSRGSLFFCVLFSFLLVVVSIPLPLTTHRKTAYGLIWLLFFLITVILSPLLGMMLRSVPKKGRATATSLAIFCFTMLGYFPAPFIFGAVADRDVD